jgi:hypothetical protein
MFLQFVKFYARVFLQFELPLLRCDYIFENVEIIYFIVKFDYLNTCMGSIQVKYILSTNNSCLSDSVYI